MIFLDFVDLLDLHIMQFLFSGIFLFALLQTPGERKGETASSSRRIQESAGQSLSFSVSNRVFLENSGCIYLSSVIHVACYILCKKFTVQKGRNQTKRQKTLESTVFISSQRDLWWNSQSYTEHRNSCGWLRPWNSFDQSFLSLRLSLL